MSERLAAELLSVRGEVSGREAEAQAQVRALSESLRTELAAIRAESAAHQNDVHAQIRTLSEATRAEATSIRTEVATAAKEHRESVEKLRDSLSEHSTRFGEIAKSIRAVESRALYAEEMNWETRNIPSNELLLQTGGLLAAVDSDTPQWRIKLILDRMINTVGKLVGNGGEQNGWSIDYATKAVEKAKEHAPEQAQKVLEALSKVPRASS